MTKTLEEKLSELSPERRAGIEKRTAELIAEEYTGRRRKEGSSTNTKSTEDCAMKAPTKRQRVVYTRKQVLAYLATKLPEIDWSIIADDLPLLVWRHRWTQLSDRLGLPFTKGHLQNEDSRGVGPASYPEK